MAEPRVHSRAVGWGVGLAAVLGLAVAAVLALRPHGALVQVAPVTRGDLRALVQCDGILEPQPGSELRAPEGGLVAERPVRDGDPVRPGQVLLRLDNPDLAAQRRQAEADALRLQADTREAEAGRAKASEDVEHWQGIVATDRRLVEQSAATRSELEGDELALGEATARQREVEARLAALCGPSGQAALARDAASAAARRLASLVMRSPREGVVYGLPARLGEMVQRGQLVASIADPGRPRVRLRVDQPDLPKVAVGQLLLVTFSGLPGREWQGRVTVAAPVLREADGRQVGEIVGALSDPGRLLPLNASVDARIVLAERHGVLTVPRAALYREDGRRFVYLLRGGRARQREVDVGLVGLTEVEITGGLAAGDRVVIAGELPLAEGLRVTPAS